MKNKLEQAEKSTVLYELSDETKQNIDNFFIRAFGMSYNEFEKLDDGERKQLISKNLKKLKIKKQDEILVMIGSGENSLFTKLKKGELYMIGSGEDSCFVRAGITAEEEREELEYKTDQMVYSKPVVFLKKLRRKFKNSK